MKKILSIVMAAALVAFSFTSCKKKGQNEPEKEVVKVTLSEGLIFTDATAAYGWWQIMDDIASPSLSLSNGNEVAQAAGTFKAEDLDPDFSYYKTEKDSISFTGGSITLTLTGEYGSRVVTVKGSLDGNDGKVYQFDLTYSDPTAKTEKNLVYNDAELDDTYFASYGDFTLFGMNETEMHMVMLDIYGDAIVGEFTDDDLDPSYSGVYADGGYQNIFAAEITVAAGAGDIQYVANADILCNNNTLYHVTFNVPVAAAGAPAKASARKLAKKVARR